MTGEPKGRAPAAFNLDDPRLSADVPLREEAPAHKPEAQKAPAAAASRPAETGPDKPGAAASPGAQPNAKPRAAAPQPNAAAPALAPSDQPSGTTAEPPEKAISRTRRWGGLFLSAVGGLFVLAMLIWVQDTFLTLLGRHDWIGWAATILLAVAVFSFAMILGREIAGLARLSAMTNVRKRADSALMVEDTKQARVAAGEIRAIFAERRELADGIARLKKHERDIMDAKQVLGLTERELLVPLDKLARATIGSSGRRVLTVTTLSPAAIISVGFVAYENFRMLRNLASIYGGRPGIFAILKLMRLIAGHLALTGGIAFTDDILSQVLGHGLTARVSKRLGEGLINGGFTMRIGLAAVEVLRPLPYVEAKQPRFREFVSEFLKVGHRFAGEITPEGKERGRA
ncbi:hypothetical protein T281_11365 [Rhodomicrobium udaipurense JA643]|uniref:TIGR01620 family protein n=1 Tax=Rhodomicrobium udaipurense TaxID=1202716 RepID=A0A8I1GI83_9HYPH|nr:TIGR01620 family protein [Rhodomicrobium udaipurense]KAI94351.1 hypothetical protein T281_11365 [Rhodomicrobium udaipurense JA643]MBJ7544726.1 TIGR01620 family protein [Rhodomicrobium udaipurense]